MKCSSASNREACVHGAPARWLVLGLAAAIGATGCGAGATSEAALASRDDQSRIEADLQELDRTARCDGKENRASLVAALPAIRARLQALEAQFRHGLPAKEKVARFFEADGFYQNGLGLDAWLDEVLLKPRATPEGFDHVGLDFGDLRIDEVVDANHVFVTYTVAVQHHVATAGPGRCGPGSMVSFRPWTERMLMTKACGQWRLTGNQLIAKADAHFLARLAEKPLSQAQLDARPDVFTILADWDPLQRLAYLMWVPDPPFPGLAGWIGFPGDATFGVVAWVGDNYDYPWTPDVNERELRRQYNQYLASASSRVKAYMVFEVSATELDARVATVHVTGPGLPAAGLNLVRSDPQFPRAYLIFRGDQFHWNAFSTERCASMAKLVDDPGDPRDYIPDCALDWSQIASGAGYLYSYLDEGGTVLGQMTRQLRGEVLGEEGWYAAREQFYGQYTLAPAFQFTIANVLDTSAGSPFAGGGEVELTWRPPARQDVRLEGVSYWREYSLDDAFLDPASRRQEEHWHQLYGTKATSLLVASDPNAWLTSWAWSTLIFRDEFGNEFDHEVSPVNPY